MAAPTRKADRMSDDTDTDAARLVDVTPAPEKEPSDTNVPFESFE